MNKVFRVAVLASGSGSNLQALIDAMRSGQLPRHVRIALVLSDRSDAYALQRALDAGIPTMFLPLPRSQDAVIQAHKRAAWEQDLATMLNSFNPNLVILSGFMRILSPQFLALCQAPLINQHPALLPDLSSESVTTSTGHVIPTLRGAHVVAEALEQGLAVTGCSIHRVTAQVDDGPILARAEVAVLPDDTETTLHERIKAEERRLIVEVVAQLASATAPDPQFPGPGQ